MCFVVYLADSSTINSPLTVGSPGQPFKHKPWGAFLNSDLSADRHTDVKNVAVNTRPGKGDLFGVRELKQGGRVFAFSISARDGHAARLEFHSPPPPALRGSANELDGACGDHRLGGSKDLLALY